MQSTESPPQKQITLDQFAEAIGLSKSTICSVFREASGPAPETAEKVRQLASSLGYIHRMKTRPDRLGVAPRRRMEAPAPRHPHDEWMHKLSTSVSQACDAFFLSRGMKPEPLRRDHRHREDIAEDKAEDSADQKTAEE